MEIVRRLSLQRKLSLILVLTLAMALSLATGGLLLWEYFKTRDELVNEIQTQAEILAGNLTAPLQFADADVASETLQTLRVHGDIRQACVYDDGGHILAGYRHPSAPDCPAEGPADGWRLDGGWLVLTRRMVSGGRPLGTLMLGSATTRITDRLRVQAFGIGFVLVGSSVVALLLTAKLQRLITDPLLALSRTARAVSRDRDYSLRAPKLDEDEVGQLVEAFNDMLAEIQRRDDSLRTANEGLERRVDGRTRELKQELGERRRAEEQLAERNAELLRSNQELDDFAHIASHDLREPLRGIHNYAKFLVEDYGDTLDADGVAKLQTLTRLSQRMEDLIESLLHYSRLGRVDLAVTNVKLQPLLEEVLETLEISLADRAVEIRVPRPLPVVRCDQVRVAEVFRNLITNAMKYNDKPHRWIEIGWRDAGEPDGAPTFYVKDNGIGIPPKHLEGVFRIFKRLHARDLYGGGSGAGLTIVRKIIERHDGRIWIESEVGEGTSVLFTLGRDPEHATPAAPDDPARRG